MINYKTLSIADLIALQKYAREHSEFWATAQYTEREKGPENFAKYQASEDGEANEALLLKWSRMEEKCAEEIYLRVLN